MPLAGGAPTAHVDTFARDRLPPRELWPEMGCPNLPELEFYPARLNAAAALLDAAVVRGWGSRIAVRYGGLAWSYRDLQEKVDRVARVLVDDMGLRPGQRVLLRSPNTPMMAAAWLAVLKAGGIAVATMPLLRAREIAVIVERAQVSHALCSVDTLDALSQARSATSVVRHVALFTDDGDGSRPDADLDRLLKAKSATPFPAVDTAADDPALIAFTSGTTGRPKGCVHFHRDVLAICDAFPRHVFGARMDDVYTGTPPLAFVYGLGGLLCFPLRYGGCTAFPTERATPEVLLRTVAEQRCTTLFSSPAMYRSLSEAALSFDVSSLKKCVSAGETLPATTFEAFRKATGLRVIDGIGSTELLHMFVAAAGDAIRPGATGRTIPGYEVRVADDEGRTVPAGELGQIAVRGFTGCRYLDDAERQRAYVRDGWNYPGDVYRMDADGYFWYQARADDMIISAGYNIAGPEVEAALLDHPRVRECAVVAAADPERGTIVKAFVVLREAEGAGESLARELQEFVKKEIAPYKYPRAVEFVPELPRTETGKLQRYKLRQGPRSLKIVGIGGGPAGLYFAILVKKLDPRHDVTVVERNRPDDTFGWGVVFSDETLSNFEEADPESHAEILRSFANWTDIDVFFNGERTRSTGHGFCGVSRRRFLNILQDRAAALGVRLVYETEGDDLEQWRDADLVLAADGANSRTRDGLSAHFQPSLDWGRCKFVWLGTDLRYEAFTFIFKESEHGLFQVHAYPFDEKTSTFIVECREEVWKAAGLDAADEAATVAYLSRLFADDLQGHRLLTNRSIWRSFPTVRNERWHHGNVVLVGDAAHTAHFSIGSGTKLAMEDAIALAAALRDNPGRPLGDVLQAYEDARKPEVGRLQTAARTSLEWFENSARYRKLDPLTFTFSLLTRSKRITYDNLARRDPRLVESVTRRFAGVSGKAPGEPNDAPPIFQPYRLRGLRLPNRIVVSPMCQYSCEDGTPTDWHLVHLGSRAVGGAGLVFAEATHVSRDGRITPYCAGMYKPEHVPAWRRIVDFVHGQTTARIGLQIAHAGRKGSCSRPWDGDAPLGEGGWDLVAPSAIPFAEGWPVPRAMTRADMDRVREEFVRAARMADECGFDVIELHMAHGYLLATFISPLTNERRDEYGGPIENRLRYPLEVFEAVRAAWPGEKPVSIRISGTDWKEGGLSGADRVALGRIFKERGADAIDVSGGSTVPDQRPVYGRMFQVPFSEEIRLEAGIPTMTVGNVQDADQANTILAAGRADLVVMARPHLVDPYLTLRAAARYGYEDHPWPPQYLPARPRGRQ